LSNLALNPLRESPFDLLLHLEARVRVARADAAAGNAQTWTGLAFRMRDIWCVAPRDDIREVIPPPTITRVPGAKTWMLGVANVRGSLLPVTDLAGFVGEALQPPGRNSKLLVLNSDRVPAGLVVDEVAGYRQFVPADQRHSLKESAPRLLAPYLLGAFAREGRPWLVISLRKLSQTPGFLDAG
jgi:twitching motility protein PilI